MIKFLRNIVTSIIAGLCGLHFMCFVSSAQTLDVKSFDTANTDLSAAVHPRKDLNGEYCALVKIAAPNIELTVQGNVVGVIERKGSEYWCYITPGTKKIRIVPTAFEPLSVVFEDYGTESVESRQTYTITLGVPESSSANYSPGNLSNHLGDSPYFGVTDNKKIPIQKAYKKCKTVILGDYAFMTLQKASEYDQQNFDADYVLSFKQPYKPMGSMDFPMNATKFSRSANTYVLTLEQANEAPISLEITFNPQTQEYTYVFTNIDGEQSCSSFDQLQLSTQNNGSVKSSDSIFATTGVNNPAYPFLFDLLDCWHVKYPK